MRSAAFKPAALASTILAASLALAACEAPPPVELGPQGQGGISTSGGTTDEGTTDTASVDPTASGSLLDAGAGARLAAALVDDDARYFEQAELSARISPTGSTVNWRNPATGTSGTITPLADRVIGGQDCRDFFLTATIDGRQHSESATACQTADGWATRAG